MLNAGSIASRLGSLSSQLQPYFKEGDTEAQWGLGLTLTTLRTGADPAPVYMYVGMCICIGFSFFLKREREHEQEGQERRENPKPTARSMEPDTGLYPTTLSSPHKPKPRVGCPTDYATQALLLKHVLIIYNCSPS